MVDVNLRGNIRKEGTTPWEDSRTTSGLIQLALEKLNVPRTGHVLVPGCGKARSLSCIHAPP